MLFLCARTPASHRALSTAAGGPPPTTSRIRARHSPWRRISSEKFRLACELGHRSDLLLGLTSSGERDFLASWQDRARSAGRPPKPAGHLETVAELRRIGEAKCLEEASKAAPVPAKRSPSESPYTAGARARRCPRREPTYSIVSGSSWTQSRSPASALRRSARPGSSTTMMSGCNACGSEDAVATTY